jgi:hypothetical protein
VKDGTGATIWSSRSEAGSSSGTQGWRYQITSGGTASTRCIASGPVPAAVRLVSPSKRFSLQVSQQGADLRLMDANGTVVWAPQGAQPGSPPARLCITAAGQLQLSSSTPSRALWSSSYAVGPASRAPFVAQVSDAGCLEVLDGQCALLYSTTAHGGKAAGSGGSTSAPSKPATGKRTAGPSKSPSAATGTTQGSSGAKQPPAKYRKPDTKPSSAKFTKATKPAPPPTKRHPPTKKQQQTSPAPKLNSKPQAALSRKASIAAFGTAHTSLLTGFEGEVPAAGSGSKANNKVGLPKRAPRPPPARQMARASSQCALPKAAPCGGVELCGKDGPCKNVGCCKAPSSCRRTSQFVWLCK